MSGYIIRRAFSEDKDEIIRLHDDVYSGLDYLPDYFDDFMKDPLIRSYVYEEFGEIIGYLASQRVDGGATAIDRAGRVNPRYIGMGVYRKLLSGVEQLHKEEGLVQRHALVKIEPPSANFRKTYRHVTTRNIHTYEFQSCDDVLEERLERDDDLGVLQNSGDTLPPEYFNNSFVRYLFPEKRVLIDWVPFRPTASNIPIMKGKNTIFASDVSLTSGGLHTGLLSASSIYIPHHGVDVSCTVDLFGSDCRSLTRHMIFHLKRVQSCAVKTVNFAVITNSKQDPAIMDKCLRKFGIERPQCGSRSRNNPEIYEKYL